MPSGQPSYFDDNLLSGGKPSAVSSIGFLPGSSGSSLWYPTARDRLAWGKIAGAGAWLRGSFFAPQGPDIKGKVGNIEAQAGNLSATGKSLTAEGSAGLEKVLKYFSALASGDPSQALAATQPQRGRVMDQYDAARRSASQFTPRGGGQASSEQESRSREAGQLADTTSAARSEGVKDLATLGSDMTRSGLSAEEQSINAMVATLQPLLEKSKQDSQSIGQTFAGLGELIGTFFL